ncbi:MAG: hypothetical protein CND86_00770 [Bacteroidetes bacterium MED-G21]|nr:MAG: hypothetical protein CND86_00770 [Bacteroidetes bacterium MED-G21]
MCKTKRYIIRTQALLLALLVLTLSTGYTYHWEACLHADAEPVCAVVDQNSCCCSGAPQAAACLRSEMGDGSCDLSFSKYIQFNFEAQPGDTEEFNSSIAFDSETSLPNPHILLLQNRIAAHTIPPPKSGREILHLYSVLVI